MNIFTALVGSSRIWLLFAVATAAITGWLYVRGLASENESLKQTVTNYHVQMEAAFKSVERSQEATKAAEKAAAALMAKNADLQRRTQQVLKELSNVPPIPNSCDRDPAIDIVIDRLRRTNND